jgi:ATP-dependent helicase/nuclease subunit B
MSPSSHLPRLWTIPSSAPFLDTLANALVSGRLVPGDHVLHEYLVLLPTRRACRFLTDRLVAHAAADALLLPRIRPIGDVDEVDLVLEAAESLGAEEDKLDIPPAIAPLRRQVLLTKLVLHWGRTVGRTLLVPGREEPVAIPVRPGDAALLARDLARLLDDFETEGSAFSQLSALAPTDHPAYWQLTLEFLRIATEAWPNILRQERAVDPVVRRDALLRAEAARLAAGPHAGPVIAAGSTGTIPATAELLSAIARLPFGAVVLPGLDAALDDDTWAAIDAADTPHPGHPQYGLKRLLDRIGALRDAVQTLATPILPARERLVSEALRPAMTTERWAKLDHLLDATAAPVRSTG